MSRHPIRIWLAAAWSIALLGLSACGPDNRNNEPSGECETNADCSPVEICVDNRCELKPPELCEEDMDCTDGVCISGFCETCEVNADCPSGEICTDDYTCEEVGGPCEGDSDCPGELTCSDGSCVLSCSENVDCVGGQVCDGDTTECRDCRGDEECAVGEACSAGRCAPLDKQCRLVGQVCQQGAPTRPGFVCVQLSGENSPRCHEKCRLREFCSIGLVGGADDQDPSNDEPGIIYNNGYDCPSGSLCEIMGEGEDVVRACRRSDCTDPERGQGECDAIAEENPEQYPNGANCVLRQRSTRETRFTVPRGGVNFGIGFEDDAFLCQPAGTLQEDEACGQEPTIGNPNPPKCGRGLTCIDTIGLLEGLVGQGAATCRRTCLNDAQCNPGQACIGEDASSEFQGVGICGDRCDPFEVDNTDCPEGSKCLAVSSNDGICSSLLGAPGDAVVYGDCTTGGDANCPSGTVCLGLANGQRRCTPQCDPTLRSQEVQDATCFGGDPKSYVKFAHLAQGEDLATVDIYIDDVLELDDLAFQEVGGADGSWLELEPGNHQIDLVPSDEMSNNRSLRRLEVNVQPNTSTYFVVIPGDGELPVQVVSFGDSRIVAQATGNRTQVRFAHAVGGVGTVDLVATGPDEDVSVPGNQTELATGLSYGSTTSYGAVPAGTYDVYVFAAGQDPREAVDALAILEDVELAGGTTGTVVAYGQAAGANPRTPGVFVIDHERFQDIPETGGLCYDLTQGTSDPTRPGTGVCFQRCPTYMDYGAGTCTIAATDACSEFGDDISVCFPQGQSQVGEDCSEGTCEPGSFCDLKGDGTGTCRSYCTVPGYEENTNLAGCSGSEECMPSEDIEGLGECRLPCTPNQPGSFVDPNCPDGQKTCRPHDNNFFCSPSGDTAIGDECVGGDTSPMDFIQCEAGSLCARQPSPPDSGFEPLLESFLSTLPGERAYCRQLCRPFLPFGQSDCDEGYACNPILPTQDPNVQAGICQPVVSAQGTDVDPENPDACPVDEVGALCGDAAFCTSSNTEPPASMDTAEQCTGSAECFYLCDPATGAGCPPSKECSGLGSTDVPNFFIGVYGICRDR